MYRFMLVLSIKAEHNHRTSTAILATTQYSTFVDERPTPLYFLEIHITGFSPAYMI